MQDIESKSFLGVESISVLFSTPQALDKNRLDTVQFTPTIDYYTPFILECSQGGIHQSEGAHGQLDEDYNAYSKSSAGVLAGRG